MCRRHYAWRRTVWLWRTSRCRGGSLLGHAAFYTSRLFGRLDEVGLIGDGEARLFFVRIDQRDLQLLVAGKGGPFVDRATLERTGAKEPEMFRLALREDQSRLPHGPSRLTIVGEQANLDDRTLLHLFGQGDFGDRGRSADGSWDEEG